MRIANAAGRAVLIREDGIVDIATASGGSLPDDPQAVFDHWDELVVLAARVSSADAPLQAHDLLAPVPRPRQVFAIGVNYSTRPRRRGGGRATQVPADVHEVPDLSHRA